MSLQAITLIENPVERSFEEETPPLPLDEITQAITRLAKDSLLELTKSECDFASYCRQVHNAPNAIGFSTCTNFHKIVLKVFLSSVFSNKTGEGEKEIETFLSKQHLNAPRLTQLGYTCDLLMLLHPDEKTAENLGLIDSVCRRLTIPDLLILKEVLPLSKIPIPSLFKIVETQIASSQPSKTIPSTTIAALIGGLSKMTEESLPFAITIFTHLPPTSLELDRIFVTFALLTMPQQWEDELQKLFSLSFNLREKLALLDFLQRANVLESNIEIILPHLNRLFAMGGELEQKKILQFIHKSEIPELCSWLTINGSFLKNFEERSCFSTILRILMAIEADQELINHLKIGKTASDPQLLEIMCIAYFHTFTMDDLENCVALLGLQPDQEARYQLLLALLHAETLSLSRAFKIFFHSLSKLSSPLHPCFFYVYNQFSDQLQRTIYESFNRGNAHYARQKVVNLETSIDLDAFLFTLTMPEEHVNESVFASIKEILTEGDDLEGDTKYKKNFRYLLDLFRAVEQNQRKDLLDCLLMLVRAAPDHKVDSMFALKLFSQEKTPFPFLKEAIPRLLDIKNPNTVITTLVALAGFPGDEIKRAGLAFINKNLATINEDDKFLIVNIFNAKMRPADPVQIACFSEILENVKNSPSCYELILKFSALTKENFRAFFALLVNCLENLNTEQKKILLQSLLDINTTEFLAIGPLVTPLLQQIPDANLRKAILVGVSAVSKAHQRQTIDFLTTNLPSILARTKQVPNLIALQFFKTPSKEAEGLIDELIGKDPDPDKVCSILSPLYNLHKIQDDIFPYIQETVPLLQCTNQIKEPLSIRSILQFLTLFLPGDLKEASFLLRKLLIKYNNRISSFLPILTLFPKDQLVTVLNIIFASKNGVNHLVNILQTFSPGKRAKLYHFLLNKISLDFSDQTLTERELPEALALARKIVDLAESLLLKENDPLFEKAVELLTTLDRSINDPKHPITLYRECQNNLSEATVPKVKQLPALICGKLYVLNLKPRPYPFPPTGADLPKKVNSATLKDLFEKFTKRFSSLEAQEKNQINDFVENSYSDDATTKAESLSSLIDNLLFEKPHISKLMDQLPPPPPAPSAGKATEAPAFQSDQPIDLAVFYLAQILQVVLTLNDDPGSELLSQQETALFALSCSLQNCPNQIDKALRDYYIHLSEKHSFIKKINANISEKVPSYVNELVQKEYQKLFDFNAMYELIRSFNPDQPVSEIKVGDPIQQVTFLKNMLGPNFGLRHNLHYDPFTGYLHDALLSPRDVLIQKILDNAPEISASKIFALVKSGINERLQHSGIDPLLPTIGSLVDYFSENPLKEKEMPPTDFSKEGPPPKTQKLAFNSKDYFERNKKTGAYEIKDKAVLELCLRLGLFALQSEADKFEEK